MDASHIYGQDQCEARSLRQFQGGRLVTTPHPIRGKGLLPTTRDNKECRAPSGSCFAAGGYSECGMVGNPSSGILGAKTS